MKSIFRHTFTLTLLILVCTELTLATKSNKKATPKKPTLKGNTENVGRRNSLAQSGQKPYKRYPADNGQQYKFYSTPNAGSIAKPPTNNIKTKLDITIKDIASRPAGTFVREPGTNIIPGSPTGIRMDAQPNVGGKERHGAVGYSNLQLQQNTKVAQRGKKTSTSYAGAYGPNSFFQSSKRTASALKQSADLGQTVNIRLSPPSSPDKKYKFEPEP